MKRIVLWFLSTVSVVVLLFGYHTSTSSTMATSAPTSIVSGTTGTAGATSGAGGAGSGGPSGAGGGSGGGSGSADGSGGTGTAGSTSASGSPSSGAAGSSQGARHRTPPAPTTVTGDVVSTVWGPVQVQLTLRGHTITGVRVLQHPNGNPQSDAINAYALPILVRETTQAQGADIDMVSGATFTSAGYEQSLQSALDQAGV